MSRSVYAVATMDTKGHELAYVVERLRATGVPVVTVDVGTLEPPVVLPDVDQATVAECHPLTAKRDRALADRADRGQMVAAMGEALEVYLASRIRGRPGRRSDRDRRQRRHGADHAGDAGASGRPAQADGLDRRQRERRPLCGLERHHDDVLGRRHRRIERRLAPGARQRCACDGGDGPDSRSRRQTKSRRWA